jgi:hypothetical protein
MLIDNPINTNKELIMSKALKTDDSVNTCDCCGRSNLKFTVLVELDNGELANYGSTCASRNTSKSPKVINAEIKQYQIDAIKSAKHEYQSSSVFVAYLSRLLNRPRTLVGRSAFDFIKNEYFACEQLKSELSVKYSIKSYYLD